MVHRSAVVIVCAAALGYAAAGAINHWLANLGQTSVWFDRYCDPSGANCLYARFERIGAGVNASDFAYIFTTEDAAKRGLLSNERIECSDVTGNFDLTWSRNTASIQGADDCSFAGSRYGARLQLDPDGQIVLMGPA